MSCRIWLSGWITREDAAAAAGIGMAGLPRVVQFGTNAGWLETRVPKPGVWTGPVEPPVA